MLINIYLFINITPFCSKTKIREMQGTGSCKSMFYQPRTGDSHLRLYEILNADIYELMRGMLTLNTVPARWGSHSTSHL
jgi:hypothetical protein